MNSSKQIKWGAILSYVAIAVNIISGLIYTPWMVSTIGKSQYGLYTLANTVISMFMVDFGLSHATSRYLSKYNAESDKENAERILGAIYKLYLMIDAALLVVLSVVFIFIEQIYVNLTPAEIQQFKVVFALCAIYSLIHFPFVTFNGILSAYEKFVPLKMADLLHRIFLVGFTVVALLMGYGLYALVIVHVAVGLLTLLFKYIMIRKTVPLKVKFQKTPRDVYKEIFGFSLWVTVSSLALRLIFNITPSILGIVASSAAIAVFGVVTTVEGYAFTITNAINGMFMPRISQIMVGENSHQRLNDLFLSVGKLQFMLNGLIVVGFTVVGQNFVELWMGKDFAQVYWGALLVIAPGMFYNSLQIGTTTIVVLKKVKINAFVNIGLGILNVALSFPLSAKFGALGACLAIGITYTVRAVVYHIAYNKVLPLNVPKFMKKCYLPMAIPVLGTIALGLLINHLVGDGGWGRFLLKAVAVVVVYIVLVYLIGLSKTERKQMFKKLKRG